MQRTTNAFKNSSLAKEAQPAEQVAMRQSQHPTRSILAVITCLVLAMALTLPLAGCGSSGSGASSNGQANVAPATSQPEPQVVTPEPESTTPEPEPQQSSPVKDFSIEGKWKQTGANEGWSSENGRIIVFDGTNCNLMSPRDTYALYTENGSYRLGITTALGANAGTYTVKVIDNDHIEIGDVFVLQRVG